MGDLDKLILVVGVSVTESVTKDPDGDTVLVFGKDVARGDGVAVTQAVVLRVIPDGDTVLVFGQDVARGDGVRVTLRVRLKEVVALGETVTVTRDALGDILTEGVVDTIDSEGLAVCVTGDEL